jgi:hypothetical protein
MSKRSKMTKRSKGIKKSGKTRRRRMKAGNPNHTCCMCGKTISNDGLMPRSCYMKHGDNAHRICQECWWDPNTGFSKETATHGCPGCLKGIQLSNHSKLNKKSLKINRDGVIELSSDTD